MLGDVLKPKSFAGLFGAAPSVALATLGIAIYQHGAGYAAIQGGWMMAGAVALALYSVIVCHLLVRARLRALPATSHDANPRLAVLAQGRWYEYLIRFALGGGATVFTGLISSRYGAAVGGLFLALPAIFCASASLIEKHEIRRKREAGLSGERRGKMAAALDSAGAAWGSPSVLPRGRRQGAQACGVG